MTRSQASLIGGIVTKLKGHAHFVEIGKKGGRPRKILQSTKPAPAISQTRDYAKLLKLCSEELNGGRPASAGWPPDVNEHSSDAQRAGGGSR